jgi:hypothetical protein
MTYLIACAAFLLGFALCALIAGGAPTSQVRR